MTLEQLEIVDIVCTFIILAFLIPGSIMAFTVWRQNNAIINLLKERKSNGMDRKSP